MPRQAVRLSASRDSGRLPGSVAALAATPETRNAVRIAGNCVAGIASLRIPLSCTQKRVSRRDLPGRGGGSRRGPCSQRSHAQTTPARYGTGRHAMASSRLARDVPASTSTTNRTRMGRRRSRASPSRSCWGEESPIHIRCPSQGRRRRLPLPRRTFLRGRTTPCSLPQRRAPRCDAPAHALRRTSRSASRTTAMQAPLSALAGCSARLAASAVATPGVHPADMTPSLLTDVPLRRS